MRTYLTCGSALALALAISTGSARAQERQPGTANAAPAASEPAQDDQKSSVGLEEIVVTARKVEEKLQDVPVAVSAISGASLDRLQIRSPQDLTYQVPSLDMRPVVSDPGSSIAIGIRGQENSQAVLGIDVSVGLYIDGINQPRPFGFKQNLIDIQRIEVLRGPQGTLYGRNATGGAMSLYTHNPEFQPGGYVELSAGERNTARADAMLNLPIRTPSRSVSPVRRRSRTAMSTTRSAASWAITIAPSCVRSCCGSRAPISRRCCSARTTIRRRAADRCGWFRSTSPRRRPASRRHCASSRYMRASRRQQPDADSGSALAGAGAVRVLRQYRLLPNRGHRAELFAFPQPLGRPRPEL